MVCHHLCHYGDYLNTAMMATLTLSVPGGDTPPLSDFAKFLQILFWHGPKILFDF